MYESFKYKPIVVSYELAVNSNNQEHCNHASLLIKFSCSFIIDSILKYLNKVRIPKIGGTILQGR